MPPRKTIPLIYRMPPKTAAGSEKSATPAPGAEDPRFMDVKVHAFCLGDAKAGLAVMRARVAAAPGKDDLLWSRFARVPDVTVAFKPQPGETEGPVFGWQGIVKAPACRILGLHEVYGHCALVGPEGSIQ